LTKKMLDEALAPLGCSQTRGGVLVDLRDVAGYESGCATRAREWLSNARQWGLRRVAVVTSSSVLRTAGHMAAYQCGVEFRMFEREDRAEQWLKAADASSLASAGLDATR